MNPIVYVFYKNSSLIIKMAMMIDFSLMIPIIILAFGETCDINKSKFCAALQICERTPVGDRCKCENGYRFSKDRTCSGKYIFNNC